MELVKPIKNKRQLIPFEQFYIQKHYQENKLITEQHPEYNPLIQLAIDTTNTSRTKINNEPPAQGNRRDTSTRQSLHRKTQTHADIRQAPHVSTIIQI